MVQPPDGTSTRPAAAPLAPVPPSGLTVMALPAADQHVLVVVGEADLATAGQLRAHLIEMLPAKPLTVLVDLGALEFCDLAGLDALHDAARAAHDADIVLTFRGMSPRLAWLHRTFPPRGAVPPQSTPGLVQPVPDTPAAAPRSTPTTARTSHQPSGQNARAPRTWASLRAQDGSRSRTAPAVRPSDARHPRVASAQGAERRTARSQPQAERYLELEQIVDRLAQLALHAHALVERTQRLPPAVVRTDPARAERTRRLQAGAELARRALTAAARLDLETTGGADRAERQTGDRRRTDRRATTRPTPVGPARGGGFTGAGEPGADATPRRADRPAPGGPTQPA